VRVDEFDFELPEELIALRPAVPRDAARLLVVRPGGTPPFEDRMFRDVLDLFRAEDVLVFNDTRVIPARLHGRREREGGEGAGVEATLIERLDGARWRALVKPAKRVKAGDLVRFGGAGEACFLATLDATVEEKGEEGEVVLAFAFTGPILDENLAIYGRMPLPPYIAARRPPDDQDREDYQTVFARREGAVAAPTAGLHFTEELMKRLQAAGIGEEFVTLHVSPGTFLPVKAEDTADHRMHAERGEVRPEVAERLNAARRRGGRLVAVGTTAARLLESAVGKDGAIAPFSGSTDIFIAPSYRFRAVDLLLTNFHLPRSSLFMLVSAFSGLDVMKAAYAHAIARRYRFYSYGDACLLFPARHER
jgi:S-adenosylmethionine:tRNA ribosyltransferase-isomerase